MKGSDLLNALRAAGRAVDLIGKSGRVAVYACRVNRAEVREILGDKNWNPSGMDHFTDGGHLHFHVWKRVNS